MIARPRRGFTLFELILVLALLLLLAAVIIPSLSAFRGDSRPRAAADMIRSELAVARARAMEEGRPYRVAISTDGTRIRRAPDSPEFDTTSAASASGGSASAVDYPFEHVTASVVVEQEGMEPASTGTWVTIAVVKPDGTCREETTLVMLKETDGGALYVRIRGLTGSSQVVSMTNANGAGGVK